MQNIQTGREARATLFFGGGCRHNPGALKATMVSRAGSCFRDGQGIGDYNHAEWIALSFAFELSIAGGASDVLTGSKLLPTTDAGDDQDAAFLVKPGLTAIEVEEPLTARRRLGPAE